MKFFIIICIICVNLLNCVLSEELESKSDEKKTLKDEFVPTAKWQIVKKGQSIPRGLHVRINLETGLTEAKLLEKELINEEKKQTDISITTNQDDSETELKENIKNSLQHIKNEDPSPDDDTMQRVNEKFKKYEQIKKEMESLNLSIKTDAELLRDLFKKYDTFTSSKQLDKVVKHIQLLNVLEDIGYLVHQIDNANEFSSMNGFNKIIYDNFNSSSNKIKCQVLNIHGTSTQNNPTVQIHALETGSVDKLLRLLALETNNEVLSRTLYAIGSLLRRFPLAQKQFINNGGLSVFTNIFEKPQNIKIQIRILTLLYDLLMEHSNAMMDTDSPLFNERLKQYNEVNLKNRLQELKWCDIITNILREITIADKNNHDSIEKCLNIMSLVLDICQSSYSKAEIMNLLIDLNKRYKKLSEEEIKENKEDSDVANHTVYFQKLKALTDTLIKSLNMHVKTEL